jgi:hypothetical protein
MKKLLTVALVALVLPCALVQAAEYTEPPLVPLSPSIMAQGGAAVAAAHGYESFFYNPAGFSRGKRELVIPGVTTWLYSRPDALLAFGMAALAAPPTPTAILDLIGSQVTGGGFGIGASAGIGFVGDGLGLGMVLMMDSLLRGPTLLGLTGDMTGTLAFIGGFSAPVALGKAKLHLGVDVRPMLRFHVPLTWPRGATSSRRWARQTPCTARASGWTPGPSSSGDPSWSGFPCATSAGPGSSTAARRCRAS